MKSRTANAFTHHRIRVRRLVLRLARSSKPMINRIALRFTFLRSGTGRTIPMDWSSIMANTICFSSTTHLEIRGDT